jgi:hypothetical protein
MRAAAFPLTLAVPLLMLGCSLNAAGTGAPPAATALRRVAQAPPTVTPIPPEPPVTIVPVEPPEEPGKVRWASPEKEIVLFRPKDVVLDWTSTFPEGTVYSVTLSRDGKDFPFVVGNGITKTHYAGPLPEFNEVDWYLRVKAMDATGQMLDSDVVMIHVLPRDCIVVSKQNQTIWSFKDGKISHRFKSSTGEGGYVTRAGWFDVYFRLTLHHSSLYDVDMPYSLFFSGGQAIHASTALSRLGSPASHGCVRLPLRNARTLFNESPKGRPVIVTRWGRDMRYLDAVAWANDST